MSRHTHIQSKKKMPTVHKVLIIMIAFALVALAVMIVYGITNLDNQPGRIGGPGNPAVTHDPNDPDDDPGDDPGGNPGGDPDDDDPDDDPDDLPELSPRPRPELDTGIEHFNPLTGEVMDLGKARQRPIAIVLNNLAEALPLNGVSKADVIYEYPVEGGLTRMLAIYQDVSDVRKVGSIRSLRHYTAQLANAYDAIVVAAGRSPQAQQEVRTLGIPFLNEVEGPLRDVFFRDRNRIPGRRIDNLHSVVTTGERLLYWLPEYNIRLMHEESFEHIYRFKDDGTPQNGSTAGRAVVRYSGARTTTFTYNQSERKYFVQHGTREFTDANDNSKPAYANILVLKTSVSLIQGDDSGRLNINTSGSGTGYYISGGKYIEINWSRANQSSPFIYTHTDGTSFDFGVGKTYICIIPTSQTVTFS